MRKVSILMLPISDNDRHRIVRHVIKLEEKLKCYIKLEHNL